MDSTDDLSARILLKHILNVEPPRTPLTRSVTAKSSAPRRSGRLNQKGPDAHTPQGILRRSLKHKMRESISSKTLPSKRRTASTVLKRTPGQPSMLFDDGDTPRQIFKNILLTEPVKSPLVNEHVEPQEQLSHQPSPDSSLHSRRPSIELSGLELSDLTIGNVETTVKRLSRKRPHRSLNVTAFEKRLKGVKDVAEEESLEDYSSLSLSSSTSLSLKTPFNDVRTERKALQRKGSNRRKVSEEDFGAAVDKREMGNHGKSISACVQLGETTCSEGFTLGLSKISEPDITTDIVHCKTALYAQTDGIMSNYSTLATQDKPTVMASQIQSDLREQLDVHHQPYPFPLEENTMTEDQDGSQSSSTHTDIPEALDKDTPFLFELEKSKANHTFDVGDLAESEKVNNAEDQTGTEDDAGAMRFSQSEDKPDIQTENHGVSEDGEEAKKEDPASEEQSHQISDEEPMHEEEMQDEEESEEEVENEKEEDETAEKGGEEEGDEEEVEQAEPDMGGVEKEAEDSVGDSDSDKVVEADSKEDEDGNSKHITQRAVCTDGELIMPIQNTDADFPDDTIPERFNDMAEPSVYKDDATEVEADLTENKENTFQESGPPDEVVQVEYSGEEEEEEEDCNEDFPVKTPAFIKEKRNFLNCDPQASPFTSKNIQPSDADPKSKQKAQRKPRSPKSDIGLPKSYLMNVFKHFAKTKVSADVYPVLKDVMDKFFDRLAKDLETYALHARRSTIDVADCELLLRRQGHVNDKVPVEVLIEKYLRMDQRNILIPIATSGNVVFPKRR